MNQENRVYCLNCKCYVEIENERSRRCSKCNEVIEQLFEERVKKYLNEHCYPTLRRWEIKIGDVKKVFDLVSEDEQCVGDVKFYKNTKIPAAKFSTISEYVWLLQKSGAKKKFLVFGRDCEIPKRWLKRYSSLLCGVEVYFFDAANDNLERFVVVNHEKVELRRVDTI